jgi:hypothetical protein
MKPIARNAMLVATLMVLSGCANQQVLMTPDDRLSLSSYPHFIAIHYPPEQIFRLTDPGAAMAAAIVGPLVAIASQLALQGRQRAELEDPAPYVKDRLVNALRANFKLTNVRPPGIGVPAEHQYRSRYLLGNPPEAAHRRLG